MMPAQGRHIVERYGSIAAFAKAHEDGRDGNFVLNPLAAMHGEAPQVLLKAYWGFDPENWPCLTLTDRGRVDTILAESRPGFLCAIYASIVPQVPEEMRGKVIGLYQLSHDVGEAERFLTPSARARKKEVQLEDESWKFAFRAIAAWKIPLETAPRVADFAQKTYNSDGARSIARFGAWLAPEEANKLLDIDLISVPLQASDPGCTGDSVILRGADALAPSKPGPVSQSPGVRREAEGPKHLYMLCLDGTTDHFLGKPAHSKKIVKVGFSKSPTTRRDDHNRALPAGAFKWRLSSSTYAQGMDAFPTSRHALAGEDAMKAYLLENGESLGGEFFLASDAAITQAWRNGIKAAMNSQR
jgi:hypothetical protein